MSQTLENLFEQALSRITLAQTNKNLLEAQVVQECLVEGKQVTVVLSLPPKENFLDLKKRIETDLGKISEIEKVMVLHKSSPGSGTENPQSVPREPKRPKNTSYLQEYKEIIAVGSGKGGVGKSTVALNLALSLKNLGHEVSIFDADIYGPSLPTMLGMKEEKPQVAKDKMLPIERYGLYALSLGNLVEEAAATIWRGPIVHQVLEQLIRDTRWPGGDFMIIDLPPGTGDAQITLSQILRLSGVVIVSTPQDLALLDAMKGVSMFEKVEVPVLGLVENMSSFLCPHCDKETAIFNTDKVRAQAEKSSIPFLGNIPLELQVRIGGDEGKPVTALNPESLSSKAFAKIAEKLVANFS